MSESSEDKIIYTIMEPNFITPVWFSNSMKGLEDVACRHKHVVKKIQSLDEIAKGFAKSIVIVGTTRTWLRETIDLARQRSLRPILIGGVPGSYGEDVSGTMYGSKSTIEEMVRYFHYYNRNRIALIDINLNSSNDMTKYETFLSTAKSLSMNISYSDVYFRNEESKNPTEIFLANIRNYDGVICSNDYSAGFILTYCKEHGVRVPEDLFVAGLGDIVLCRYTQPSLTSATRSYYEAGIQVFQIWRTINQNPAVESIITTMQSYLKPRGSTANLPVVKEIFESDIKQNQMPNYKPIAFNGSNAIRCLEECLSRCDDMDMKIIKGVLNGDSNEAMSEKVFCSTGTINYRLKNLYKNAGVSTKTEFADLIRKYLHAEALIEDSESIKISD